MFTIAIVALCVAVLFYVATSKKPPAASGSSPILDIAQLVKSQSYQPDEPKPERRIQLLSQKLQEVADERLMNDTLEDLGVTRPKPSRPVPAP